MANPSVRGYQAQNLSRLINGIEVYVKNVIQPKLVDVLTQKATELIALIDTHTLIPEYLGHLHDATGVGIYVDGTMAKFIPTKIAIKMGKCGFDGVNHYQIDGNSFLNRAIDEASSRFARGIWFVIFSAVPYAYHINKSGSPKGRGQDFFNSIVNTTVSEIIAGLRPIADSVTQVNAML